MRLGPVSVYLDANTPRADDRPPICDATVTRLPLQQKLLHRGKRGQQLAGKTFIYF